MSLSCSSSLEQKSFDFKLRIVQKERGIVSSEKSVCLIDEQCKRLDEFKIF
ncbi:hypothetical protein VIBNISO65_1310045 [Vibrio nigripulchritudo SO65]|nr:hypothetical protein VIBNIFTn2_540003 [Vibrio nigripulchritudo FTn2]CCN75268.1 hypothetical protein VIBNISO65_1310045 [Vibrio nigripulchritudo SO65]